MSKSKRLTASETMPAEMDRRQTNRDAVAEYFKAHPNQWVSASRLAEVGGTLAWRSRVSECRTQQQMYIENMQERSFNLDGSVNVQSSYRYLTAGKPLGRAADVPDPYGQPRTLFAL